MSMIYNFTQNQLKVLLKGIGYDRVVGLDISTQSLENESVLNALNELTRAGIISSNNERFEVVEPVKEIICGLGNSYGYIALHSNNKNLPDKCLFMLDKLLVCTSRVSDRTHISVEFIEYGDFFGDLCDEGYIPVCISELSVDEEKLEEYEKELFEQMNPNEPLSFSSSIILSLDELTVDEQLLRYFRVVDYYFYTYIVYNDGKSVIREIYSPDKVKIYLEKMMNL